MADKKDRKSLEEQAEEEMKKAEQETADMAKEQLDALREQLADTVPGMDTLKIVDNYVEKEFKTDLDKCKNDTERSNMKAKLVKHYVSGPGKSFINQTTDKIKTSFGQVKEAFANLPDQISAITLSMSTPSVITVGEASSSPNPAHTLLDAKAKVGAIKSAVLAICSSLLLVFEASALIHFDLPEVVVNLQAILTTIMALLAAIPI